MPGTVYFFPQKGAAVEAFARAKKVNCPLRQAGDGQMEREARPGKLIGEVIAPAA